MISPLNRAERTVLYEAEDAFFAGRYSKAIAKYLSLAALGRDTAWTHFRIGRCYLRMGDLDSAQPHLEGAAAQLDDHRADLELLRLYALIGDHAGLARTLKRRPIAPDQVEPILKAIMVGHSVPAMFELYEGALRAAAPGAPARGQWTEFFERVCDRVLAGARTDPRIAGSKLTFSETFPHALAILTAEEFVRLLRAARDRPVHIVYASWNLRRQINQAHDRGGPYGLLTPWKRRALGVEGGAVVLDASEEAPTLGAPDLEAYQRTLFGRTLPNVRVSALTANIKSAGGDVLEYNIYPLIVELDDAFEAIAAPPTKDPAFETSFLCGVPRPHRCAMMLLLERAGALESSVYSWWGSGNQKAGSSLRNYAASMLTEYPSLGFGQADIAWLTNLPARRAEDNDVGANTHHLCTSLPLDFMLAARLHVVFETDFNSDSVLRMTEKTVKTIAAGVPFLMLAVPGFVAYLRGLGFDMLDEEIDHGYDAEADGAARMQMIVAEIMRMRGVRPSAARLQSMRMRNAEVLRDWMAETRGRYVDDLLGFAEAKDEAPVLDVPRISRAR